MEFVLGDLRLQATNYRGGPWLGETKGRAIFGRGGWRKPLPEKFYAAGPRLSTVLGDAARECGETLQLGPDRVVGKFFVREAMPAQRAIASLCPAWWVDLAGVTHTEARIGRAITSRFDVQAYDAARGVMRIGTAVLADWQPANTFASEQAPGHEIECVVHHLTAGGIVTEVFW